MTVGEYRHDVARRIADGQHLEQIEAELIETAALPQDEKDALWLYALGCEAPSRPFSHALGQTTVEPRDLAGIAHD
jgi:hypothetical protein